MVINGASTLPWPIHLSVEPPLQLRPWWCLSFYEAAAGALVVQVTHWTSRCPFLISVGCIHLECSLFQLINEECQTIACQLQFAIAGVQLFNVYACLTLSIDMVSMSFTITVRSQARLHCQCCLAAADRLQNSPWLLSLSLPKLSLFEQPRRFTF